MRVKQSLLLAGLAVPFFYFGTLIASSLLYPGYSHLSQFASELGMADQPSAVLFNNGILLTALAMIAGSMGIYQGLRSEGVRKLWALPAGVTLGLAGVGLFLGGLFPMPDPRHGGFGLVMGIHLAPIAIAVGLWSEESHRGLRRYLISNVAAMTLLLGILFGVGALVTRANVGLFQRLYALTVFPWVGIVSYALLRDTSRGSA